jgi:ABC-type nitrate/sulfonate/bicarbonate transport system substrate-binding protein
VERARAAGPSSGADLANNLRPAAFANKSIDAAFTFDPYLAAIVEQDTARLWMTSGQIVPTTSSP